MTLWEHGWISWSSLGQGQVDRVFWKVAGEELQRLGDGESVGTVPNDEYGRPDVWEIDRRLTKLRDGFIASLGRQGWEMVAIQGAFIYFKRPIK